MQKDRPLAYWWEIKAAAGIYVPRMGHLFAVINPRLIQAQSSTCRGGFLSQDRKSYFTLNRRSRLLAFQIVLAEFLCFPGEVYRPSNSHHLFLARLKGVARIHVWLAWVLLGIVGLPVLNDLTFQDLRPPIWPIGTRQFLLHRTVVSFLCE